MDLQSFKFDFIHFSLTFMEHNFLDFLDFNSEKCASHNYHEIIIKLGYLLIFLFRNYHCAWISFMIKKQN